jgi:transcriptional regulator of acetoin/glycerol metabolism
METMSRHVERIMSAAYGGYPVASENEVPGHIYRSWLRCLNQYKLHPTKPVIGHVETSTRLRECREQVEDYLHVARAGMEQLYKCVAGLGYVLLLADAEGVTIDYIGDDSWDRELREGGLHLGANWKEAYAGTNGIGTCVIEKAAMTCHREDHFFLSNTGLSCITTPLFDPEGEFMGVLDISALQAPASRESAQLALGLTTMHGRMIEDANFMRHFGDRWILRLATAGVLADVSCEVMLALDADGVIVGANSGARRRLRVPAPPGAGISLPLVGRSLPEVFRDPMEALSKLRRINGSHDRAVLNTVDHVSYFASLLPPRAALNSIASIAAEASSMRTPCPALDPLAGNDRNMQRVLDQARRLVNKRINVLIQGETGTGKEVFARAMHDASSRAQRPFIAINCAAIPESLIESELFGYTAGTFTGARTRGMKGMIQQSDGGTLFLDEIGDMPLPLQTRLLRVLSEREVLPLGSDKPIALDLTVIAASHRDLRRQIAAGTFREDLYYRLCGATLSLPPLRERQDRAYIIDRILQEEAGKLGAKPWLHDRVLAMLQQYPWPGNVRELRNVLRFAVAMSDGEGVYPEHLPPEISEAPPSLPAMPGLSGLAPSSAPAPVSMSFGELPAAAPSLPPETQPLMAALRRHKWNISAAATELGICRTTLYRQMKRYGITPPTHW